MSKVLILKGLPASGKSTFAKKLVSGDIQAMGNNWKRVNKDDLRAMIDNSHWSKQNERLVLAIRDLIIVEALSAGANVVVDDTNLDPRHETAIRELVASFKPTIEIKTFYDVTVEQCLERNIKRANPVREHVIWDMYNRYLRKADEVVVNDSSVKYTPPAGKPKAILVDVDGTLAHMTAEGRLRFGRQAPFMWGNVMEDAVDEVVANLVRNYYERDVMDDNPAQVIIMSGRDSVCRDLTEDWLKANKIPYDQIFMRKKGDSRKDNIVKRELFDEHIRDFYQVEYVLDDRDQVVEMWRNELGLKVLQVAAGAF